MESMMEEGKRLMLSESCLILENLLQGLEEDFTRLLEQDLKDLQKEKAELSRFDLHFLRMLQALGTKTLGKMELESEKGESTCQQERIELDSESGETRRLEGKNLEVEAAETEASKRDEGERSIAEEEISKAFFDAVERNDIKRVRTALKAGADISWRKNGYSALLVASALGYDEVMDALLEYGSNVEDTDPYGDRPLHLAVRWAWPSTVERLVAAGANITVPGQAGRTPLHMAAREGSPDSLSILLKAGAPIEGATVNGNRALHFAAMCGKNEAVARLVASGADIHAKGEFGKTPLQLASACGQQSTVQLLRSLMEPK